MQIQRMMNYRCSKKDHAGKLEICLHGPFAYSELFHGVSNPVAPGDVLGEPDCEEVLGVSVLLVEPSLGSVEYPLSGSGAVEVEPTDLAGPPTGLPLPSEAGNLPTAVL